MKRQIALDEYLRNIFIIGAWGLSADKRGLE